MSDHESDVARRVTKIVQRALPRKAGPKRLDPALNLRKDLMLDSMGLMNIAFRVEEEFGIDVAAHEEALNAIETLGDVIEFVTAIERATPS